MLRPEHFDAQGWPPGEAEKYTPILLDCFDLVVCLRLGDPTRDAIR
jgi:hypothetical protein